MSKIFYNVSEFQRRFIKPLPPKIPALLSEKNFSERGMHLLEEWSEAHEAQEKGDLPGVVDGLLDMIYVGTGILVAMGIPPHTLDLIWENIHAANMQKIVRPTERYPDGDLIKPPGWKHPNIAELIGAWQQELGK